MARADEIAEEVEALTTHYRVPVMSAEQRGRWLADWCRDLAEFPAEAIHRAFEEWRQSDNDKFPTIGRMISRVRLFARQQASGVDMGSTPSNAPWSPISDQEYEALPIWEKVRHHRTMADQARLKAGPQWRNKKPVPAEDMPEAWHIWRAKAKGHDHEALELQKRAKASHDLQTNPS